jgi:hypothetical protein
MMRPSAWISLALACAPVSASAQAVRADEAWAAPALDGARAALAARPRAIPQKPAEVSDEEALRSALIFRLRRNPVAAEFAVPILEEKDGVTLAIRSEAEDAGLKGAWAQYKRDRRAFVLNRDAIGQDLGEALGPGAPTARQLEEIADRYLPVIVHEIGGHARHYEQLGRILGEPAPNVRETETNALRLEAMATAAERRSNPSYLRDGKEFAKSESALVDKYWESKEKRDPSVFSDYVDAVPGYAKIPSAFARDPEAKSPVAAFYRNEQDRLIEADRRLVGDDPPADEIGVNRPEPFEGGGRFRR